MELLDEALLQYITPHFKYAIHRICSPAWKISRSIHSAHNIILVYEGEAIFECNHKNHKASTGSLIYFKPGDLRYAYTFSDNLMKCYAIDFMYTCPIHNCGKWEMSVPCLPFQFAEEIENSYLFSTLIELFYNFTKVWISEDQNKTLKCRSIFLDIIRLLLSWKNIERFDFDKSRKVESVISYMTDYYSSKLTLRDLAAIAKISPSYLGSIFKEVTGKSPIDYLIDLRIKRAKELIQDGHSITETAALVGFCDIFYFSKCFTKHEGVTPLQFKGMG